MLTDFAEYCPILAKKSKLSLQIDHHYFGDNLADQQNDALGIAITFTDDNLNRYSGLLAYQPVDHKSDEKTVAGKYIRALY